MFGKNFKKLVESERYKNSDYLIQKINDWYALKRKRSDLYVDLLHRSHLWGNNSVYFKDCLGSKSDVISAFNYRCPIIIDISNAESF
jgi:hypothetical protein